MVPGTGSAHERMNDMGMKEYIDEAEKDLLHTYNRYQVVIDHGKGVNLYDTDGKEYLDFMSGIGVYALGYGNKEYNDALKAQIDKITHTSNLFYNVPAIEAAKKLKKASGMDRVFFTNSGAEAVEGAIKTARKYAYLKDDKTDHEVIALEHSFHGRTMGALSVTGKAQYREPFEPMIGNIKFAEMNDLESVTKKIDQHTCAILLETVQGEGGIHPATLDFLKALRKICDKNGLLLMLDEVQCGMGRTGSMFAYQKYGVKPDVVMSAKALGCGVPVGAFMMTEKTAQHSLTAGDHGTTYGGNPLACAAVSKVLDLYDELDIISHVNETAPYFEQVLDQIKSSHSCITDRRGTGFMQGLEFDVPVGGIISKAMDKGLILLSAGPNVLRFLPPLIMDKEHIDMMADILDKCI